MFQGNLVTVHGGRKLQAWPSEDLISSKTRMKGR